MLFALFHKPGFIFITQDVVSYKMRCTRMLHPKLLCLPKFQNIRLVSLPLVCWQPVFSLRVTRTSV